MVHGARDRRSLLPALPDKTALEGCQTEAGRAPCPDLVGRPRMDRRHRERRRGRSTRSPRSSTSPRATLVRRVAPVNSPKPAEPARPAAAVVVGSWGPLLHGLPPRGTCEADEACASPIRTPWKVPGAPRTAAESGCWIASWALPARGPVRSHGGGRGVPEEPRSSLARGQKNGGNRASKSISYVLACP